MVVETQRPRSRLRFLSKVLIGAATFNLVLNDYAIQKSEKPVKTGIDLEHWQLPNHMDDKAHFNYKETKQVLAHPVSSLQISSNTTRREKNHRIWEDSPILPQWMKDYFAWHEQERAKLNENNWESYHYLLLRCVPADKKCSGASDRLKAVPLALLMAHQARQKRLLFIAWQRPALLEEFLVPPEGGFDWRLPDWLATKLELEAKGPIFWLEDNFHRWPKINQRIVRIKNLRGSKYYETLRKPNEATFEQVYRHVWTTMFEPSPAVAARIQQQMDALDLKPGKYVSAHVRSMYVSDTQENQEEEVAVNCASQLGPGLPIYFASDSTNTTRRALAYGKSKNATIVGRLNEPIHLDRGRDFLIKSNDWKGRPPSDFYDVFVDLYLLAGGRCVAFGVGGYGSWASLLSANHTCSVNHRNTPCNWTSAEVER